jgi:1-acyl-sn-glycerol-3-phosphate acyltransferase
MLKDLIYRAGTRVLTWIIQILFKLKVYGRSHIPQGTGLLLVARHRSYWDIPLLIAALGPLHRIYFVARRTLNRNWLLRPFLQGFAVSIDREHFRSQDYRQIVRALEAKRIVGIFPEGTTKHSGLIRTGVVRFAEQSDCPILPIHIAAEGPYPPRYPLGFPRVAVQIGRPFRLRELESRLSGSESRAARYGKLSLALMERIDQAGSPAVRFSPTGREA